MSTQPLPPEVEEYLSLQLQLEAIELSKPENFGKFVKASWPIIEPGIPFLSNWHIDVIGEYIHAVRLGQILRLIVNMPPRMAKSVLFTIDNPCHWWLSDPHERFIFSSYGSSLVKEHSMKRRSIIESDWYQTRWGAKSRWSAVVDGKTVDRRIILASDQNEKLEFWNTLGGTQVGVPVEGQIMGKGGGVIIYDDPQDPTQANSDAERVRSINFLEGTLLSRLNNKATGRIIGIQQRLGTNDWTAHELAKDGWTLLELPAEYKQKTYIHMPLTKKDVVREAGTVLWEERESQKTLNTLKIGMTLQRYEAQYNQKPSPAEGNMLKRVWWRHYKELPETFDIVVDSWDFAFKKKPESEKKAKKQPDFNVGTKWGVKGADAYLLGIKRQRMDFPEALEASYEFALDTHQNAEGYMRVYPNTKRHAESVLIEEAANGHAILQTLRDKIAGVLPIVADRDKVQRASAASPVLKAGNILVPDSALITDDEIIVLEACLDEAAAFSADDTHENDDFVDSCTQFINWYVLHCGGMLAWVDMKVAAMEKAAEEQAKKVSENGVVVTNTRKGSYAQMMAD